MQPDNEMDKIDEWEDRKGKMKCSKCIWFVEKKSERILAPAGEANKIGRCRRHSPSMNGYPLVFQKDWCGDHKLNENS